MSQNNDIVIIQSAQRTSSGDTPNSFTLKFSLPFKGKYRLEKFFMTNSWYNVNSNNNMVYFNDTGGDHKVAITPGFYTPAQLATQIASQMTSAGSQTYTGAQNPNTNTLTLSAPGNFKVLFGTGGSFATIANSIASLLGFQAADTTNNTSVTGSYPMNVNPYPYLNILVGSSLEIRDVNGGAATFNVPITAISTQTIFYEPQVNLQFKTFDSSTSNIKVQVLDPSGNLLGGATGLNNVDWYMTWRRLFEDGHYDKHGPSIANPFTIDPSYIK
jgi:hypothetical protein